MSKPIPAFQNENEDRVFRAETDSSEVLDWSQAKRVLFPNLKPTTQAISLRLPVSLIDELHQRANQRDVPYQSLIKMFLRERIDMKHGKSFAVLEDMASFRTKFQSQHKLSEFRQMADRFRAVSNFLHSAAFCFMLTDCLFFNYPQKTLMEILLSSFAAS